MPAGSPARHLPGAAVHHRALGVVARRRLIEHVQQPAKQADELSALRLAQRRQELGLHGEVMHQHRVDLAQPRGGEFDRWSAICPTCAPTAGG